MTVKQLRQYNDLKREYAQISRNPAAADRMKVVAERLDAIQTFMDSVDDTRTRQVIFLYVIKRQTWLQVSIAMEWGCSAAPRKHLCSYLKRYSESLT